MISPTPLLGLTDLKVWRGYPSEKFNFPLEYRASSWFFGGAAALAAICGLMADRLGRPVEILLPAYFCGQSLRYLRSQHVKLNFYRLDKDLLPEFDIIQEKYPAESVDVFVHVHYFGRVAGQKNSRILSDKLGAVLIEDCAHVISPDVQTKWVGDVLLFSPHKHFPLPQIGLALSRDSSLLPVFDAQTSAPIEWVLRQFTRRILRHVPKGQWGSVWSFQKAELDKVAPNKMLEKIATHYLQSWFIPSKKIKSNVAMLMPKLREIPGWVAWGTETELEVPYLVGMRCDNKHIAQKRYALLNQRQKLVMQWPDLPGEIKQQGKLALEIEDMVDCGLFFFVHQQLNKKSWLKEIDAILLDDRFK